MSKIKVLIADDHRLFRQGLRQILEIEGGFEVVGEAENGAQAAGMTGELSPDVILMDINMPVLDGVRATQMVSESYPGTRVVILTMYRQDNYVFEAIKAGARGYVLKDADENDLIDIIRSVHRGEAIIDPEMAARVLDEFSRISQKAEKGEAGERLTPGEMDVLRLVAKGYDNKRIAKTLAIAERTVANRLREIYDKLRVNNRTQAALVALRKGWADLYE